MFTPRRNPLSLIALLRSRPFFVALLEFDRDLAAVTRAGDCPYCAAPLHRADYRRKPRGLPEQLGEEHSIRFSFCCAREDCRKRTTSASVRFLGPRVFTAAAVLLVTAMRHGVTPARARALCGLFGVSLRTLNRWRAFWLDRFPTTTPFVRLCGDIVPPPDRALLPCSLLESFSHLPLSEGVQRVLHRLAPLTTRSAAGASRSLMVF